MTVFSNQLAFAVLTSSNDLVCIGSGYGGGGCCSEINNVKTCRTISNIKTVTPNAKAFAALLRDGTVVSFGDFISGGCIQPSKENYAVCQPALSNIQAIFSTSETFAALSSNGDVSVWGKTKYGGGSSLKNIVVIVVAVVIILATQ